MQKPSTHGVATCAPHTAAHGPRAGAQYGSGQTGAGAPLPSHPAASSAQSDTAEQQAERLPLAEWGSEVCYVSNVYNAGNQTVSGWGECCE